MDDEKAEVICILARMAEENWNLFLTRCDEHFGDECPSEEKLETILDELQ